MYSVSSTMTSTEMQALALMGIIYLIALVFLLVQYVLTSMALYTLAKRRGVANPFLAWIPVADSYITGVLAEGYDAREGHKRGWGKVLLIMSVIGNGGVIAGYVGLMASGMSAAIKYAPAEPPVGEWLVGFLVFYVVLLVGAIVFAAAGIVRQICVYKIYESTVEEKAVKYLLLSLMVPLAGPISLFMCRNKGYGMEETIEETTEVIE